MAGSLIIVILVIFFSYAFAGVLAFFPFLLGLFQGFFTTCLDLIKFNLYPVGSFVYIGISGIIIFIIIYFIIHLFTKHSG